MQESRSRPFLSDISIFQALLEAAPDAMVIVDQHGKIILSNVQTEKLFGYTRQELLGQPVEILLPESARKKHASLRDAYMRIPHARPMKAGMELSCRRKDGSEFPAEISLSPLQTPDGILVSSAIRDLTERKLAENMRTRQAVELEHANADLALAKKELENQLALQQERAQIARELEKNAANFRFLFAKNPIPMMVMDCETLRYLEVNEAAVNQYGYSRDEFLKLLATEIRKPEEAKRLIDFLKQKRGVRAKAGIWHHLTKDGRTIEVEIIAHEMDFHNRSALLVAALNVTEKRALESQLRQAQKFEAIGQLAGGIAHDFNNMLGAILGWVELGIDDASSNNQLQNYFLKVKHQAERAAELTHQLLAFARRQILEPRNMDLNRSVREVTGLLAKVIRSDIELKLCLEENLPAVKADPTQVEQVIMNLCLNARDALPQGGKLEIRTYSTELTEGYCQTHKGARVGPHVCLAVSDTGTGIDPQTLERIFEPFFTTKDVGKGTGLGLATVYGIVKQHGGFIDVRSQIGYGTQFEVFFPASLGAKDEEPKLAYAKPAQGGQETVLLAEDHEGLREIASTTLAGLGYQVKLAHDGVQAVEEFLAKPDEIALVLLDIVLPRLNGAEAYARMSSARPGLPVVFVTGYGADSEMFRSVMERKLPLLQKPYGPRELAQKVREALDRKEQFAVHK